MIKITKKEGGAALVEYGILVGMIAVLSITAVLKLGTTVDGTFEEVSGTLSEKVAEATNGGSGGSPSSGANQGDDFGGFDVPPNCQFIAGGSGGVNAEEDYPGVTCFQFEDTFSNGENFSEDFMGGDLNFDLYTGPDGIMFFTGNGNSTLHYSPDACSRTATGFGMGDNSVVFGNKSSDQAYFNQNEYGDMEIIFDDGARLGMFGNITEIQFTDGALNASQISSRASTDSQAPLADCGSDEGPPMGSF
jgi:Flp pilus assembly pilin Flp